MQPCLRGRLRNLVRSVAWPLNRWRDDGEIHLHTHYPGCVVRITKPDGSWHIDVSNRDPSKISNDQITSIFLNPINENFSHDSHVKRGVNIDFRIESVCLESWRDIQEGRISELIEDSHFGYERSKIGAFGFLAGNTKPERRIFYEMARDKPDYFEFIATEKYSKEMDGFISLIEYKKRFKYIIDLPGHAFSTKSYWMLFMRRPLFYVRPKVQFRWERALKPWIHYIPVQ